MDKVEIGYDGTVCSWYNGFDYVLFFCQYIVFSKEWVIMFSFHVSTLMKSITMLSHCSGVLTFCFL